MVNVPRIVEAVLAACGAMKFAHECFEVLVHVYKIARRLR